MTEMECVYCGVGTESLHVIQAQAREMVSDLSPQRPGFESRSVHVGSVMYKVTVEQAFLRVLQFFP
jgi:hypothetical protein